MARIVCLANSYKLQGRCIAGIDIDTGQWIRPIPRRGSALYDQRFIDGKTGNEPNLLEIVEIPLVGQAPDKGCQPENSYIGEGIWKRLGRMPLNKVNQYVENTRILLHSKDNKVDPDLFKQMHRNKWKSLQLISVTNANFRLNPWKKKRCVFRYSGTLYELPVTDPIIINKIIEGENISRRCFLTISLATAHKSPSYDKLYCWKMVAGVIEL